MNAAAVMISGFIDALQESGVGPELTQKIVVAATPAIVAECLARY